MKLVHPVLFLVLTMTIAAACSAEQTRFEVSVKGKGPAMLFIPGLNSPAAVWRDMIEQYSPTYETHALTLAGFAGVPLEGEPSLVAVKNELVNYIKKNKLEKPILIGHSLGGFLALWVASEIPAEVGPLVIVDSLPFLPLVFNPAATEENMRPLAAQQTQGIATADEAARRHYYQQSVSGLVSGAEDIASITEWGVRSDPRMTAQAMYELYTTDLRDDLVNIKTQVLVLGSWQSAKPFGGTMDTVRAQFEMQYTSLPGYSLAIHESARHFVMLDASEWTIAQVNDFLK